MNEKKIKVTDKRLFTSDGELRNEYRDLDKESGSRSAGPVASTPEGATSQTVKEPVEEAAPGEVRPGTGGREAPVPSFFDLVGIVAQPIALYLGDARMPDGESMENLELARLYIDLLDVLRDRCEGNLTPEEESFLTDLLYQLRLRYVEKSS